MKAPKGNSLFGNWIQKRWGKMSDEFPSETNGMTINMDGLFSEHSFVSDSNRENWLKHKSYPATAFAVEPKAIS